MFDVRKLNGGGAECVEVNKNLLSPKLNPLNT